jgi:hypothetical protein
MISDILLESWWALAQNWLRQTSLTGSVKKLNEVRHEK